MSRTAKAGGILLILSGLMLSACGGGGGGSNSSIGVTLMPSTAQSIDQGQKISLSASVSNDSSGKGVTWSLTGPGNLSNQTATTATYTAPTSGAAGSASVTATAVANGSANASLNIAIATAPTFSTSSLPAAMIGTAYSQTLAVMGGAGTLTYAISGGSLPAGLSLNTSTGAISGTPTGPVGSVNFTAKVTDSSTAGAVSTTQALSITVNPAALVVTTTSLLNPIVGENYSQTLQTAGGTAPVTWSILTGALPAGLSLNASTGAISGVPTSTTAATAFTVQAVDSSTPTPEKSIQALSLTVTSATACGTGSESLLNGAYAMSLTGFDGSGPVGILGSFTSDGAGHVTAGLEDINSTSGVQLAVAVTTAGSSYSIGGDHRGCLTLVAGGVTRVFRFSVSNITSGVASGGRMIEFDQTGTNVVGTIGLQDPASFSNSAINGNYAFRVKAPIPAGAGGGFFTAVGILNFSGTTVTGSGDFNSNGMMDAGNTQYPAAPITFTAGTFTIGANGRGTISFTPPGAPTIHLIAYVAGPSQLLVMSSDTQSAATTLFSGFAGPQTGAPYANSSLSQPIILYAGGLSNGAGSASRVEAGEFTPDGAGNFTLNLDVNSGGSISTQMLTGTYTIASDGRVQVTNAGDSMPDMIFYMGGVNQVFAISTDAHVMNGDGEPQTGGPFTNGSINGSYSFATIDPVVAAGELQQGVSTYDGAGNETGTFDVNVEGTLSLANAISQTYAVSSSGRVVQPASGTTQTLSYVISPGKLVSFDASGNNTNPALVVAQQ